MTLTRDGLAAWLDALLEPHRFHDYAPNGLQIEGRDAVERVAFGVSANQTLIDQAIAWGADALVVHHGFFWKNEAPQLVGWKGRRIGALLRAEVSLFAYHLPLDAHPEVGNSPLLLRALGAEPQVTFGPVQPALGVLGALAEPTDSAGLVARISARLQRDPLVLGPDRTIRTIACVTGGGASFFEAAVTAGADAFVTGEPSEQSQGYAVELGVPFFAAGHHATERLGVQALQERIGEVWPVETRFLDVDNPV